MRGERSSGGGTVKSVGIPLIDTGRAKSLDLQKKDRDMRKKKKKKEGNAHKKGDSVIGEVCTSQVPQPRGKREIRPGNLDKEEAVSS